MESVNYTNSFLKFFVFLDHHGMEMEMTKILDKMGDTAITRLIKINT